MRRGIRFAPGCIHAADPEMAGAGRKEQKSSIEVGAGRRAAEKYDMIRTADGKKREETRMQEEFKEKSKDAPFEFLRILSGDGKTERSRNHR